MKEIVVGKNGDQQPQYLVETDWLEENLGSPDLRVFDCTAIPGINPDEEMRKQFPVSARSGKENFDNGHIPGAGFIDVPDKLSDKSSRIPMMMLPEKQFVDVITRYGITDSSHVVLYSSGAMWATRVWWMLRAYGFDNASVLNGGWKKWTAEGRVVSTEPCAYLPGSFTARPRCNTVVSKDDVLAAIGDSTTCLIYAHPSAPVFGRKGRILDSEYIPATSLHDPETGVYLATRQLKKIFDRVNTENAEKIITYCGAGIAATNNAFALTLLGYQNVAVYDGSMCEWGNDESLPMMAMD